MRTLKEANARIKELEARCEEYRQNYYERCSQLEAEVVRFKSLFKDAEAALKVQADQVKNLQARCEEYRKVNADLIQGNTAKAARIKELTREVEKQQLWGQRLTEQLEDQERQTARANEKYHTVSEMRATLKNEVLKLGYGITEDLSRGTIEIHGGPVQQTMDICQNYYERCRQLEAEIKKLKAVISGYEAVNADNKDTLEAVYKNYRELDERYHKSVKEAARLSSLFKNAEAALKARIVEINNRDSEIKGLRLTIQGYREKVNTILADRRIILKGRDELRNRVKELEGANAQLRKRVDVLIAEKCELDDALHARIKEVKMLRGFRQKERDEKVEKLEAEVKKLRESRQFHKAAAFAAIYGKMPNQYEVEKLRSVVEELEEKLKHQTVTIGLLNGKVKYHKVTAEKRLAAIKHVQFGHCTEGFKSVNDFCRWLDHGDEWMGLTIKGKMEWAKKILQQYIGPWNG